MVLRGVDHVQMAVEDVARSSEYYQKLGLVLEGTLEGGRVVFLWNGDGNSPVRLELHQAEGDMPVGVEHIAFLVDDVEESYRSLKGIGVEFEHEPLRQPLTGRTVVTFQDPDGIGLQLARKAEPGQYEDFR
jgi:catechol 2,3-dioxygenase-like lactoylglutathione lyase family enzyme